MILWDLPRFLMIQLLVQIIVTPLFNSSLLNNRNKNKMRYFSTVIGGILIYVVFDFVTF